MPHREAKSLKELAEKVKDPEYMGATKRELRAEEYKRKHSKEYPEDYSKPLKPAKTNKPRGNYPKVQAESLEESESGYEEKTLKKLYRSFAGR